MAVLRYFEAGHYIKVFHNRLGEDWRLVFSRSIAGPDRVQEFDFATCANERVVMDCNGDYHVFDLDPPLDWQI